MAKIKPNLVDLDKIEKTFIDMDNEKGVLGLSILEEVKFQKDTLKKMRKEITGSGLVDEYNAYKRSNPIIAGYNAMIKNYSQLVRQLIDLLPNDVNVDTTEELEEFLND